MNASCRHLRLCERRRLTEMPAFPSRGLVWWVTQPCKQGVASQRNQSSLSSVRDQGLSAFFDAFPHTQHSTHSGEGGREGSTKGQSGQKPKEVIDSVSYFPLQLWRDAWQLGLGGCRGEALGLRSQTHLRLSLALPLTALRPQVNDFTFWDLSFPICKMGGLVSASQCCFQLAF